MRSVSSCCRSISLEDGLAAVLDLAHALLEDVHAAAHAAQLILAGWRRALAPEEPGAADPRELLERGARVLQQAMLPALGRQIVELAVDRAQIADETVELLVRALRELREQRLLILCGFGVHVTYLSSGFRR